MTTWIKVKDELPPFNTIVFVYNGFAIMQGCLLSRANGERYFSIDTLRIGGYRVYACPYEDITHWALIEVHPND